MEDINNMDLKTILIDSLGKDIQDRDEGATPQGRFHDFF